MKRTLIVAALLPLAIAGCKGHKQAATAPAAVEKGMPLDASVPGGQKVAEVLRMRKVVGRWESQPGVLSGSDKWLLLDVSSDMKFSLEVRSHGKDEKIQALDIAIRGGFAWSKTGVIVASGTGAKPPLKDFASFHGTFPSTGHMTIAAPTGKTYDLTYRGL